MDKTIRKIKMFSTQEYGEGYVTPLGEYNNIEEIIIRPSAFDKDEVISFEEYFIGGED